MPFDDIISIDPEDTFQVLFDKNNEMITRLNLLDIGIIRAGLGVTLSDIGSTGGVTLSVDFSIIEEVGFKVSNTVPSGMTLGHAIGITGGTFGHVSNSSVAFSKNYLGFVSKIYPDGYRITTSGRIITGLTLSDNTLYYLSDTSNGITSTVPTINGQVIKPVLFSIGATFGAIVLNQKETLISESTSYIKSASRTIAEIPFHSGLSAGNIVFYDISGATWAKSIATGFNTSEVFGVIESVVGATATVVTYGSVNIPNSMLNDVGQTGASGGNDIWFLSGQTAGQLQNLGPTFANQIIKPVYYAYSHGYDGVTFSGLLVNYIGYSVDSSASAGSGSVTPAVGSLQLALEGEGNYYNGEHYQIVTNSDNSVSFLGQIYSLVFGTSVLDMGFYNDNMSRLVQTAMRSRIKKLDNSDKTTNLANSLSPLFYMMAPSSTSISPGAIIEVQEFDPIPDFTSINNIVLLNTSTIIGYIIGINHILIFPQNVSYMNRINSVFVQIEYRDPEGTMVQVGLKIPRYDADTYKAIILPNYGDAPYTNLIVA